MNSIRYSLVQLNLAVVLLGGTSLFAKLISLPAGTITLYRSLFGFLFLALFVYVSGSKFSLKNRAEYLLMIITGVLLGLHWVTFFHSIQISTVAVGIVSLYTFPIITAFMESLMTGKSLKMGPILRTLVVFLGIILIIPEFRLTNQVTIGVLWCLLSACLFTVRNILVREKLSHIPGVVTIAYQLLIIFVILHPFFFESFSHNLMQENQLMLLVVLGIFFTAMPHVLMVSSLKNLTVTTASLIACMHPLYSIFFAVFILGEIPAPQVICGATLVVGGALYESFRIGSGRKSAGRQVEIPKDKKVECTRPR